MSNSAADDRQHTLALRGRVIHEDEHGRLRLDDLHEIAGAKETKAPKHWRGNRATKELEAELQKKVTASYLLAGAGNVLVIEAARGRGNKGTYAHPVLAAAYAAYLSPKLEIEMREVWLRYRAGDATLADEVLQKASAEANHWAGIRALSRSQRVAFTDTLKAHGVVERGYMNATEATYTHLLGAPSYELRRERGLKPGNLRDQLNSADLSFIMAAESLASERIQEEERYGNTQCVEATGISALALRKAIEADRRNRQKPLLR